jgi:acyl carrier protein
MAMTIDEVREVAATKRVLYDGLKDMIIARLDLDLSPDWIGDHQPLFGRGLELDSVDALELIVGIDGRYGVALDDDEVEAFGSIGVLAERLLSDPGYDDR